MTVGDLKLLLEGMDENKIVVFRDKFCSQHNFKDWVDTAWNYVVLLEDEDE